MPKRPQREFTRGMIPPKKHQNDSPFTLKPRLKKRVILRKTSQDWDVLKVREKKEDIPQVVIED
jgi:hypothetical protein